MMLSIHLLGAPTITYAGQPLPVTRRKSRAMLYYLAAHATPLARDHLLAFFWPDTDRQGAQQNLRTTLYGLRKIVGEWLQVEDDSVALTGKLEVDVRSLAVHLGQPSIGLPELQATLALYQGDFLRDFTLPDLPEFDDWAATEREYYRRLAVSGFTRLSQLYEAQQAYRSAINALDQALLLEPLQEDVQRNALRLQYWAGDRAGAIRRYEQLRALLAEEMGVPPMEETQALYDAMITDTLPAAPAPAAPAAPLAPLPRPAPMIMPLVWQGVQALPFVGRAAELQTLTALAAGHELLLIEGESGIGKSRLLEEFVLRCQQQGRTSLVLLGQARELEATLPYQPLLEALRALFVQPQWSTLSRNLDLTPLWRAEVARLLPELAPEQDARPASALAVDELRLWEGISQFLLALARQQPLVLAFDDLHWADASTIRLLGYLLRKVAQQQAAITFVATARAVTAPAPLALLIETLLREGRLQRFPLQRLAATEIAQLTEQLPIQDAAFLAAWLTELSEGNPFILVELLHYARDQQLLLSDGRLDRTALAASQVVPQTVYALIRARLARLSEAGRQVLNAASVIGREFEIETVARTVALSDAAVLNSLDELQGNGLIQPLAGLRYRFDHQLTLEVAYQEMGEPRHRLLHRRVAEALEALHRNRLEPIAGLLAYHFAEGHLPEQVAHYAFLAGDQATKLAAWREAMAFYEQAAAAAAQFTDQSQHQRILAALGNAALHAGQSHRAIEVLRLALSLKEASTQPVAEEVLYANLIEALMFGTRYAELLALVETLQSGKVDEGPLDGQRHPTVASFATYFRGIALAQMGGDFAEAVRYLQKAEGWLSQQQTPTKGGVTLGDIRFELGNIAARRGDLTTALAYFHSAFTISQSMQTDRELRIHILACNNLAYHLHLVHDPTAIDYVRRGLALAQEKGALSALPYLYSTLGELALAQHDLAAAEQAFQEGLSLARQFGAAERVAGLIANLGLLAQARGDQATARRLLAEALEQTDALQIRFPSAQIRLWLAPLLPAADAQHLLHDARRIAQEDGYQQLLTQAEQLWNDAQKTL
ncbi:MAG: AAA family ATPase [Caldilineaceae bacterium]|nr:AAA family ATPase [Caldilineaceae bacterium]